MTHRSLSARVMQLYAGWRRAFFVLLALICLGIFFLGEFMRSGPNEPTLHERTEVGSWLPWLFESRGALNLDTGVEIVGFDKSMHAADYEPELLRSNRALDLIAQIDATKYDRATMTGILDKLIASGAKDHDRDAFADALDRIAAAGKKDYDRALFADILDRLVAAGARQVVFDFVFEGPGISESGDKAFAEAIARHHDKVVLGFDYRVIERTLDGGGAERQVSRTEPYDDLLPEKDPDAVLGFVTVWPDVSGSISHMVSREDRITIAKPGSPYKNFEDFSLTARAAEKMRLDPPTDNESRIINFVGRTRTIVMTPVQDLFTPDRWNGYLKNGDRFKGKAVIVGPYSELHYKDAFPTPYGTMLGVEIQANCLWNHMSGEWIERPFGGLRLVGVTAILLGLVLLANTLAGTKRQGVRSGIAFAIPLIYLNVAKLSFDRGDIFLPLMPAIYTFGLAATFMAFDFVHSQYEKLRIRGIFGTFLAPEVVSRLVEKGEEPKLGGEAVKLTAFFSDVQSFSEFSEILTPDQLVEVMNEYLGAMTDIIENGEGTLDKYIGDAIVAMFGAPLPVQNHAYKACACALRLQSRLGGLRERWLAEGRWPAEVGTMRMRIGLNSGTAIVGLMGSERRRNYTMMGDTVNLAARCESGAKHAGVYTLVTEDTMLEAVDARETDTIVFRRIDRWRVHGRQRPVTVYEPMAFDSDMPESARDCRRIYEEALELYFHRDFAAARTRFLEALPLEPLLPGRDVGVEHTPSSIMAARCDEMIAHPPPEGWDGVYTLHSK